MSTQTMDAIIADDLITSHNIEKFYGEKKNCIGPVLASEERARYTTAYLNGIELKRCAYANDITGIAIVNKVDFAGSYFLNPETGEIAFDVLRGNVKIVIETPSKEPSNLEDPWEV